MIWGVGFGEGGTGGGRGGAEVGWSAGEEGGEGGCSHKYPKRTLGSQKHTINEKPAKPHTFEPLSCLSRPENPELLFV